MEFVRNLAPSSSERWPQPGNSCSYVIFAASLEHRSRADIDRRAGRGRDLTVLARRALSDRDLVRAAGSLARCSGLAHICGALPASLSETLMCEASGERC